MSKEQLDMLLELMALNFSVVETAMFLDTHPFDERAISMHNSFVRKYKKLNDIYNMKYSILSSDEFSKCPWEFIKEPWPWEIDFCGCN